jgi:hypothetical protein
MFNDGLFTLGTLDRVSLKTVIGPTIASAGSGKALRCFAAIIGHHCVQLAELPGQKAPLQSRI